MHNDKIPAELEPAIEDLAKQKKNALYIQEWLRTQHAIKASIMAVHRIVERYRTLNETPDLEAELAEQEALVGHQLRTLANIAEHLGQIAAQVEKGDPDQGTPPDAVAATRIYKQQENVLRLWLRQVQKHRVFVDQKQRRARNVESNARIDAIVAQAKQARMGTPVPARTG